MNSDQQVCGLYNQSFHADFHELSITNGSEYDAEITPSVNNIWHNRQSVDHNLRE